MAVASDPKNQPSAKSKNRPLSYTHSAPSLKNKAEGEHQGEEERGACKKVSPAAAKRAVSQGVSSHNTIRQRRPSSQHLLISPNDTISSPYAWKGPDARGPCRVHGDSPSLPFGKIRRRTSSKAVVLCLWSRLDSLQCHYTTYL